MPLAGVAITSGVYLGAFGVLCLLLLEFGRLGVRVRIPRAIVELGTAGILFAVSGVLMHLMFHI